MNLRDLPKDWARLVEFCPKESLENTVVQLLDQTPKSPYFIACSGGPDSLLLLLLTRLYWPQNPCIVLHYNHKMRPNADFEAQQVYHIAEQLKIPIEVGARSSEEQTLDEAGLRTLRYQFFEKILGAYEGSLLLLGQHQDDALEGFFLRLVRGSSPKGLLSPKPIQTFPTHTRLRPLLTLSKKQIVAVCDQLHLPYVLDESNEQPIYLRNQIRHKILPALDQIFGEKRWRSGFKKTFELLLEQVQDWNALYESYQRKEIFRENALKYSEITRLPSHLQRRLLTEWLASKGILKIPFITIETILKVLAKPELHETYSLSPTQQISLTGNEVKYEEVIKKHQIKTYPPIPLPIEGEIFYPWGYCLRSQKRELTPNLRTQIFNKQYSHQQCVYLDASKVNSSLYVRPRQAGDRYQPLHFPFEKKIKNLFIDHKIDVCKREQLPVICCNQSIVWIPGLPPADAFKIEFQTNVCLVLTYEKS